MSDKKDQKHMKLAKFLQTARVNAELSQLDVANHLGYSTPQFISNWERAVSAPPIETIGTLARLYQVSEEELFDILQKVTLDQVAHNLRERFMAAKKVAR
jgi:transcriptional regulator with XRE-family HTH domain